jgi:hypothetical protein
MSTDYAPSAPCKNTIAACWRAVLPLTHPTPEPCPRAALRADLWGLGRPQLDASRDYSAAAPDVGVYRQITPDSGARVARSMQASDANLPTADHFELDNIGPVQVCVPSGNGHTGMGEPWLSSILSGPGARRPGGSARAGHRGPKHSPPCRRSPTLAVHAPQTIPPSRRTRDGSTLVSNLHQLDGRDLFVALNLVAGEFRSDPYLKPQGGIASFP